MANIQSESGEKTLSQQFDEAYTDFKHLVDDDDSITSSTAQVSVLKFRAFRSGYKQFTSLHFVGPSPQNYENIRTYHR